MPCKPRSFTCKVCHQVFTSIQQKPKFCSRLCFYKSIQGDKHPFFGRKLSEEARLKISIAAKNQKHRDISHLTSKEARERARKLCLAKRGKPNPKTQAFQLANPSNVSEWHLRSPSGVCYKIRNLKRWIRENAEMFDDWSRYYKGIQKLNCISKWTIPTQYKGWTLVETNLSRLKPKQNEQ